MDMAVFLFGYAMLGFDMFQPFQSISVIYVIMNASATTYMYQSLHGNEHLHILYSMTHRSNIMMYKQKCIDASIQVSHVPLTEVEVSVIMGSYTCCFTNGSIPSP